MGNQSIGTGVSINPPTDNKYSSLFNGLTFKDAYTSQDTNTTGGLTPINSKMSTGVYHPPSLVPISAPSSHIVETTTKTTPVVSDVNPNQGPGTGGPIANATPGTPLVSTGFNVPPASGPIESTHLSGGPTYQDLMANRQQLENQYQQAYNDYAAAQTASQQQQLQSLAGDQYAKYYSGASNTENAQGLAGLTNSQNTIAQAAANINAQGAMLRSQGIGNLLGYNNQDISNQFTQQSNIRANAPDFSNFTQNAQGDVYGTVHDPRTGQTTIQSFGNIYNGTFNSSNPKIGGSVPQSSAGGNLVQQAYNTAIQSGVPPVLAGTATTLPTTGDIFLDGTKISGGDLENLATRQAGQSGIPYVPAQAVSSVKDGDLALSQMKTMYNLANTLLTPGMFGRLKGLTTNQIDQELQSNPAWGQFAQVRLQAINYLKSMAQGGGFRTNDNEISAAADSLVSLSDNRETALTKITAAAKNIDAKIKQYIPDHQPTSFGTQVTGNSVIQTKIGAVDNSWFK